MKCPLLCEVAVQVLLFFFCSAKSNLCPQLYRCFAFIFLCLVISLLGKHLQWPYGFVYVDKMKMLPNVFQVITFPVVILV